MGFKVELMQEPLEAPEEQQAGDEHKRLTLHPIPINLDLSATAQPKNNPLPVHILPTPAANSKTAAPAPKAHASPSLLVQIFRKLVATIRALPQATTYIAWHSGWFGCGFRHGAPKPRHFLSSTSSHSLQRIEKLVWGGSVSPTFCFHFSCLILVYFILF